MVSFFIRSCILSVFLLLAGYLVFSRWEPEWFTPMLFYCLAFVFVVTIAGYGLLRRIYSADSRRFNSFFLLSVFVKMFVSVVFILLLSWRNREYATVMLLSFAVAYLTFSALEILEILKLVKEKK